MLFLYDSCAHSQRKKFYLVHIRRVKKPKVRCIYQGGEDIFLWENLVLFALHYVCFLVSLWCFELCLVSMLCCSHRIVLMCWICIHLYAFVLYWLHVRMIICFTMWSLKLFPYDCFVFDQVAHMFHIMFTWSNFTCYLILVFLLLTLSWGSSMFCASVSRYRNLVPSSSQVLDLGVSEFCHCSQTHVYV